MMNRRDRPRAAAPTNMITWPAIGTQTRISHVLSELQELQVAQTGLHRQLEIAIGEAINQPQPRGNPLEQDHTLLRRQSGGRGYDELKLMAGKRDHLGRSISRTATPTAFCWCGPAVYFRRAGPLLAETETRVDPLD